MSRRLVAALALGVAGAVAQTAGLLILTSLPGTESTRDAIAAAPATWISSHVLIAIAVVAYAGVVVLITTASQSTAVPATAVPAAAVPAAAVPATAVPATAVRRVIAVVAAALALTGLLVQGAVLGIDAVIGALASATPSGGDTSASDVHRLIGEQALPLFDAVDIGLTIALMLAALLLIVDGRVPVAPAVGLIVALAVPGFTDLRIGAAALVSLAFAVALVMTVRQGPGVDAQPRAVPLPAAVVIVVAVIPAAVLSAERLVLALVVVAALAAMLVTGRTGGRASGAPIRTADADA